MVFLVKTMLLLARGDLVPLESEAAFDNHHRESIRTRQKFDTS
jgi:hypothetical protein